MRRHYVTQDGDSRTGTNNIDWICSWTPPIFLPAPLFVVGVVKLIHRVWSVRVKTKSWSKILDTELIQSGHLHNNSVLWDDDPRLQAELPLVFPMASCPAAWVSADKLAS